MRVKRGETHRDLSLHIDASGPWPVTSVNERQMAETLHLDSDRAAAIIAGSLVERRLKVALAGRTEHASQVTAKMLQQSGPLGTFSSQIDVALMFGLITPEAHKDLHVLRDIRNLFAHNLDIINFASQSIKAKSNNLKLVETHVALYEEKAGSVLSSFNFEEPRICVPRYAERIASPRERYILTAQLFCYCFVVGELTEPDHAYI